jgi:hypothetical protein
VIQLGSDRQQGALTLPEVIDAASKKVFGAATPGMNKSLQRQTQRVFIDDLMALGANAASTPDVKAVVMAAAGTMRTQVAGMKDTDPVTRYSQNPAAPKRSDAQPPVMAPI